MKNETLSTLQILSNSAGIKIEGDRVKVKIRTSIGRKITSKPKEVRVSLKYERIHLFACINGAHA